MGYEAEDNKMVTKRRPFTPLLRETTLRGRVGKTQINYPFPFFILLLFFGSPKFCLPVPLVRITGSTFTTNYKTMRITDLQPTEYHEFYANYIRNVDDLSLRSALEESAAQLLDYLTYVPEERANFAYAPGKWTIAQSLQHIIDTERIFSYRALRIGRNDTTALPGYNQDDYAAVADVSDRRLRDMIDEFRTVRAATKALFKSFTEEDMVRLGTMSGGPASVRALGFIISGHVFHHAKLYREKYGKAE
jgi:hypothetical protein